MSTHNIGFYEEISKIISYLSSNMHLISSSVSYLVIEVKSTEISCFSCSSVSVC